MTQIGYAAQIQGVEVPSRNLIAALVRVESSGNQMAVGDKNLRHHAYGPLQVRQPVCDDVNRRFKTSYRAENCLGNLNLSVEIFGRYMQMYATKKMLGHVPTNEDHARIWNGGPTGTTNVRTEKYWLKVQHLLAKDSSKKNPELTSK
jgi:hypothetical protein